MAGSVSSDTAAIEALTLHTSGRGRPGVPRRRCASKTSAPVQSRA